MKGEAHFDNENISDNNLSYCCTTPLPYGIGNFTNPPLFMDRASGDFRLQPSSPCINAGRTPNYWPIANVTDFIGNPRISGGTVDVGAYEFQSPASLLSYAWAQQYGLATDGTADFTDADGDGMNNYGEWRSDTIPTNALSVLRMLSVTNGLSGLEVTWQSAFLNRYFMERATDLGGPSPFQTIATDIIGWDIGTTTFTDTTATNAGPFFYRVGVQ